MVAPLILPRKNFRFEKLKLISYPLTVFCSNNIEKEKRRYRKLLGLFEGLRNLKSLSNNRGCYQGKEAYSMRKALL